MNIMRLYVDGELLEFGGEDVYAIELEAGDRVSASVQTTEQGRAILSGPSVAIPDDGTPNTRVDP